jgi:hypothetical protein
LATNVPALASTDTIVPATIVPVGSGPGDELGAWPWAAPTPTASDSIVVSIMSVRFIGYLQIVFRRYAAPGMAVSAASLLLNTTLPHKSAIPIA